MLSNRVAVRSAQGGVYNPPEERWVTWDGRHRVDVRPPNWEGLNRLLQGDLVRTGLFVPSHGSPSLRQPVHVALHLPGDAGLLHFRADVVHVVHTGACLGFGLQIEPLDAEVRLLFEHVSLYALQCARAGELPREVPRWIEGIRRALRARLKRADNSVLGLEPDADPQAVREAFMRAQQRWRAFLGEGVLTSQVRAVLDDYGGQLRTLCGQLMTSQVPLAMPVSRDGERRSPTTTPATPRSTTAVDRGARRYVARLALRTRPSRGSAVRRPEPVPVSGELEHVYRCVSQREYGEAESLLCEMLQHDPLDAKAQTLLLFVRARRSLTKREFGNAQKLYEAVLQREPENRQAKRELRMLQALQ